MWEGYPRGKCRCRCKCKRKRESKCNGDLGGDGEVLGGWVVGAGGDEGFYFGYGLDGSAGAYCGAVEGCGCAGEVELAGEGPALE